MKLTELFCVRAVCIQYVYVHIRMYIYCMSIHVYTVVFNNSSVINIYCFYWFVFCFIDLFNVNVSSAEKLSVHLFNKHLSQIFKNALRFSFSALFSFIVLSSPAWSFCADWKDFLHLMCWCCGSNYYWLLPVRPHKNLSSFRRVRSSCISLDESVS